MSDRLYLNLWFPSFTEREMMPRLLSVLRQFPFSSLRPGIGSISIQPVSWNEPVVFQQTFDFRADADRATGIANEFLHLDYAYEFEAVWDLWAPQADPESETGAMLDAEWILQTSGVNFIVHGTGFDDECFQQLGHIQIDFGLDTPFLHDELDDLDDVSEQRVKENIQKLVSFTAAIETKCGISGRVLWSESEENLAQKLIARLQKTQ